MALRYKHRIFSVMAEHDELPSFILITTDRAFGEKLVHEVKLSRENIARALWDKLGAVKCDLLF